MLSVEESIQELIQCCDSGEYSSLTGDDMTNIKIAIVSYQLEIANKDKELEESQEMVQILREQLETYKTEYRNIKE